MEHKDYRLAAILFTDIVGFSRMMEKDEAGTLALMDKHNTIIRGLVAQFKGNTIKTIGDAFLLEFSNATSAVKCAVAIQSAFQELNATNPPVPIVLRIGCHLGDIYFYENDALGEGINIASRLQSLCKPGRITISQEVYNVVMNKIETKMVPLGVVSLKNITREITAYEVLTNGGNEVEAAPTEVVVKPEAPVNIETSKSQEPAFGEVRDAILAETKRVGHRLSLSEAKNMVIFIGKDVDSHLERLATMGFLARSAESARGFDPDFNPRYHGDEDRDDDWRTKRDNRSWKERAPEFFENLAEDIKTGVEKGNWFGFGRKKPTREELLKRLEARFLKQKTGFSGHVTSFISVNGLMVLIWALTSPGGFPWPIIVASAWLIGLATHFNEIRTLKQSVGQLREMPNLNDEQTDKVNQVLKGRRNYANHVVSNFFVSAMLLGINLITSTAFMWALIPIGAMGIGIFSHLNRYKLKEKELIEDLEADNVDTKPLSKRILGALSFDKNRKPSSGSGLEQEIQNLKTRIMNQFNSLKGDHPFGDDFLGVLENYVSQINELSVRSKDIDTLLLSIPIHDLKRDFANIEVQIGATDNERMLAEYEKSREQISKQVKSYDEMVQEQQILKQRISNSVNGLRQMEIDLGRMKNLSAKGNVPNTQALKAQSEELKQYLTDLHQGYKETD